MRTLSEDSGGTSSPARLLGPVAVSGTARPLLRCTFANTNQVAAGRCTRGAHFEGPKPRLFSDNNCIQLEINNQAPRKTPNVYK